ncbi:DNA adenine methylase [Amphritea sp.]|uniref:DNA adenine methylase n=1 Tax=Amphritea sp. TaxID=1872502 RepID=UPI003D15193A
MIYSPLRYPGGKAKLTAYILETMKINNLEGGSYVEPFAGGAAIAWYLLLNNHVSKIYINDLNPSIYSFWYSAIYRTSELCQLIERTTVSIDEWHNQKSIQANEKSTLLERGFSTFFLNRTNRSGIINAGVIGGLKQDGDYKLDCRFNKERLIQQIKLISDRREDIFLTNMDGAVFLDEIVAGLNERVLVNIDPPYYVKGKGLYQNFFSHKDHYRLYESVKRLKQPWVVTYDDTPEINDIYSKFSPEPFGLTYTAQLKRKGREVIIHRPSLKLCGFPPDITFLELNREKKKLARKIA